MSRLPARLSAALLTGGLLALAAPASASTDPCAPVDGEVPVLCQSGPAPAADAGSLPRTGPEDVPALLAAGLVLVAAGSVAVTAGRRATA